MASLSNINGIFDVHSTGAIQFNGNHGTAGQILKSNGNAAPTWVDPSTVIGGPYLPLTGGTLTGATATASGISFTVGGTLTGTSATFSSDVFSDGLYVNSTTAVSGTQVAIVQDGAQNLQRWGTANSGQASYRFRIDQDMKFIANSGSGDNLIIHSDTGNIEGTTATFSGLVSGITPTAAANFATKAYVDAHPGSGGTVTGTGAANRVTYWSSATNVTSDAGFTYNGAGRVNTDESFGVSKDGADTVADGPFFRLTNAAETRQYLWQLDASNNIDYWYYNGSAWTQTISLLNNGGATFAGNVTAGYGFFNAESLTEDLRVGGIYGNLGLYIPDTYDMQFSIATTASKWKFTLANIEKFVITPNGDITANGGGTFGGNVGIGTTSPGHKLEVNGGIRAGIAGNASANTPALKVYAAGASSSTTAAIAIQQGTYEGDTILFADYEPHVEWGISCQNSTDQIHFTAGSSTNNLGSKTFYNNAGAARTAYIKFNHDLTDGTTLIGGNVGIGTASPAVKLDVDGDIRRSGITSGGYIELGSLPGYPANAYQSLTSGGSLHFANNGKYCAFLEGTDTYFGVVNSSSQTKVFFATGSQNSYLAGSGNFGIGTTSPANKLTVNGDIGYVGVIGQGSIYGNTGNSSYATMQLYNPATGYSTFNNQSYGYYLQTGGGTKLTILNNGNVGIGTTSPSYRLQIGVAGGLADSIRIGTYAVAKNTRQYIGYTRADSGLFEESGNGDTPSTVLAGVAGIRIVNTTGTLSSGQADNSVQLLTHIYNGGSRVALHASYNGNVGIATTSPSYNLDVTGTARITSRLGIGTAPDTAVAGDVLKIQGGNNGLGCIKAISGAYSYGVRIEGSNLSTQLACYSSSTAQTTQINFENPGNSSAGKISTTGNSTAYTTSSDYRLKENVIPISNSIYRLNQLKPSRFNFIGESNKTVDGFIAHEVQDIVPEAIVGEKDGVDENGGIIPQGIDQAKLVPLLVAAIQELEARVKELENK